MPDEQAALLRAVHDTHGSALARFVLRLTGGDHAFTEDVVQEALLRLWKKPEILERPDDAARAWLFTVARNLVIDDRRSARHHRELTTEQLPEAAALDDTDLALSKWMLSDALLSLTPDHRAAIFAAYYLGQTVPEIARRLHVPEGTVKSRLHYALRALRLALQERGLTR